MVVFSARKKIAKWWEILFLYFACILLSVSISNIWYLYTHLYTHVINNLLHGWFVCTIFIIHSQGRRQSANWGGVYSYIRVLSDWLLLKSTSFQKKLVGQDMNIWIYTPPISALATALFTRCEGSLNSLVRCAHSFGWTIFHETRE